MLVVAPNTRTMPQGTTRRRVVLAGLVVPCLTPAVTVRAFHDLSVLFDDDGKASGRATAPVGIPNLVARRRHVRRYRLTG